MKIFPCAKINLGLNIVGKREDGYHNLETVFYPVKIFDTIEINEADEFKFEMAGNPVEGDLKRILSYVPTRRSPNSIRFLPFILY